MNSRISAAVGLISLLAASVHAGTGTPVQVTINGEADFNQINPNNSPLGAVNSGDPVSLSFLLDSDSFLNSMSFPTRGYEIDQASFSMTLGSVGVGLQDPFPAGMTPYFGVRDNDPAVDGFFLSLGTDFPSSLPTDEPGAFGQFGVRFNVTYGGDRLDSLDIVDAAGTYDFGGLTVFGFAVTDGPFDPLPIIFSDMTIDVVPEPSAYVLLVGITALIARRRRC